MCNFYKVQLISQNPTPAVFLKNALVSQITPMNIV